MPTGTAQRNLVREALAFIQSNSTGPLALGDIAEACSVSRWHLSRAFGLATGRSLMRYLRERRLSEAAVRLAGGAPDILEIALDAGYNSHEAFTRAFRERFGVTHEGLRALGTVDTLELTEALTMTSSVMENIQPSRFEDGRPVLVGGLSRHYSVETRDGISEQWDKVLAHQQEFPGGPEAPGFGVSYNVAESGEFDHLCGVEVTPDTPLLDGWTTVGIPAQRYAVFGDWGHISQTSQVFAAIYGDWLPNSEYAPASGPNYEYYGDNFDVATLSGLEIWIPVINK